MRRCRVLGSGRLVGPSVFVKSFQHSLLICVAIGEYRGTNLFDVVGRDQSDLFLGLILGSQLGFPPSTTQSPIIRFYPLKLAPPT